MAIRTYHPRRGRLSGRHRDALHRLLPLYGVSETSPVRVDATTLFGRDVPLVLEIGSGMGEATVEMAAADPDRGYLAAEIHTPGVANLLAVAEERGVTNLRIAPLDALELLRERIPLASLDAVHVFFPDPWPKARHHKRRLIQPAHVSLVASRLAPGGVLHCATDWPEYASWMLETLSASTLTNCFDGYAPRPQHRPWTKFELRGIEAERPVYDLVFRKEAS